NDAVSQSLNGRPKQVGIVQLSVRIIDIGKGVDKRDLVPFGEAGNDVCLFGINRPYDNICHLKKRIIQNSLYDRWLSLRVKCSNDKGEALLSSLFGSKVNSLIQFKYEVVISQIADARTSCIIEWQNYRHLQCLV